MIFFFLFYLFLSVFIILNDLCLGQFLFSKSIFLFVYIFLCLLIFSSYCYYRYAISLSSLFLAIYFSLFSYFSLFNKEIDTCDSIFF